MKRSIMKSIVLDGCVESLAAPPGLSPDPCYKDTIDIIDVARRGQRLELLLFRFPEPDFCKLDTHLSKLLHEAQIEGDDLSEAYTFEDSSLWNCEVYDMSDDGTVAITANQNDTGVSEGLSKLNINETKSK